MSISVRVKNDMHSGKVELVLFRMWKKLTRSEHRQQVEMVGEAMKGEATARNVNGILEHMKDA